MTTLREITEFMSQASEQQLTVISKAMAARREALKANRAASLTLGCRVKLTGLKPAYLNGLTGTVIEMRDDERVNVMLDRMLYTRRFFQTKNIPGVPSGCCIRLADPAPAPAFKPTIRTVPADELFEDEAESEDGETDSGDPGTIMMRRAQLRLTEGQSNG